MRVVVVGGSVVITDMVRTSISLSWPDVTLLLAATATEGLELVRQASPDLVVIYPDFTDMSLSETLQELRRLSNAPLLVLGRQGHEEDEAATALSNAADYIWPPPDSTVIMVRLWSLLRRSGRESPDLPHFDLEQLGQAVRSLNEAIRLNPYDYLSYASRALAYTLLGDDTAAEQDVQQAVALGADRVSLERIIEDLKRLR